MEFKAKDLNYQCENQMRRTFVNSLYKANTLEEKIIWARSALFSIKSKHCQCGPKTEQTPNQSKFKVNTYEISSEPQQEPSQPELLAQNRPSKEENESICYLKQTSEAQTQTEVPTNENILESHEYISSFGEISLAESHLSFQNERHSKMEETIDTCCSFANQSLLQSNFQKRACRTQEREELINELTKEVKMLKEKLDESEEEKSKWMRKAMKRSNKLKEVEKEMDRFEKAYKKQ